TKYANIHLMQGVDYISEIENKGLKYSVVRAPEKFSKSTLVVGDSFSQHILPIILERNNYKDDAIYRLSIQPEGLVENWLQVDGFMKEKGIDELIVSYRLSTKNTDDIKRFPELFNKSNGYKITVIRDNPSTKKDAVACYIRDNSQLI